MSTKTETIQIGDREFSVTQWPADKSILMKLRVTKVFGASITAIASEITTKSKSTNADQISAFSDGLQLLFRDNEPAEIVQLLKDSITGTACEGKRITETSFNEVFNTEDLIEVYKVFLFVMKVNYGNLLKGQKAEALLAKIKIQGEGLI